jgi:hypothetical protein
MMGQPRRLRGVQASVVLHRSRLEARWALFFDNLGVKADYEPQGFATDGEPYLPDFVIEAALGILWAEVKPNWDADSDGIARWHRFANRRPMPSRAILLTGPPSLDLNVVVIGGSADAESPLAGPWEEDEHQWRPCPSGRHFDVIWPGFFRGKYAEDGCQYDPDGGLAGEARIAAVASAARSARFDLRRSQDPAA